jgi:hypothetical protein
MTESRKPTLDLFLRSLDQKHLPERDALIFRRDIKAEKEITAEMDRREHDIEVADAPLFQARLKAAGLSIETVKEAKQKAAELSAAAPEKTREYYAIGSKGYTFVPKDVVFADSLGMGGEPGLCRDVTVQECQHRVCVDQPVPLTVDDGWPTAGTDGSLNWIQQHNQFQFSDGVRGGDSWNFTYHRIKHTHDGEINFRSGTELLEPSRVRSVGVRFLPLPSGYYGGRYYSNYNGGHAQGKTFAALPDNWGQCQQWISFQVSSRTPGGVWTAHVGWSVVKVRYKDTGTLTSRVAESAPFVPPDRRVDLNQSFPAHTQFLIELALSYVIVGNGLDGSALVDYALEVQPYMNLEACSWQWPG